MKQRNAKDWEFYTPKYITDAIREVFGGIDIDPYATVDRSFHVATKTNNVYAETSVCGLKIVQEATESTIFCNPPYVPAHMDELAGSAYVARRYRMNNLVCLVPAATGTKYGQEFLNAADAVLMLAGRIRFDTPTGPAKHHAAFGSMLACFTDLMSVVELQQRLGGTIVAACPEVWYGI
jgi:methylase of polypeptide subunit release factors